MINNTSSHSDSFNGPANRINTINKSTYTLQSPLSQYDQPNDIFDSEQIHNYKKGLCVNSIRTNLSNVQNTLSSYSISKSPSTQKLAGEINNIMPMLSKLNTSSLEESNKILEELEKIKSSQLSPDSFSPTGYGFFELEKHKLGDSINGFREFLPSPTPTSVQKNLQTVELTNKKPVKKTSLQKFKEFIVRGINLNNKHS